MVSLDPEISNLLWVLVLSKAPNGSGCPSTSENVPKKKWKNLYSIESILDYGFESKLLRLYILQRDYVTMKKGKLNER